MTQVGMHYKSNQVVYTIDSSIPLGVLSRKFPCHNTTSTNPPLTYDVIATPTLTFDGMAAAVVGRAMAVGAVDVSVTAAPLVGALAGGGAAVGMAADGGADVVAATVVTTVVVTGVTLRVATWPCGRLGGSLERAPNSTY